MHYELDEDFKMRVKHNFKLYVLLTSKCMNFKQEDVLGSIYELNGYKSHKTVKYERNSSHIHIKFGEECMAREAVDVLNNLDTDLTAVLVDDMLRDWFNYEIRSGQTPPYTLTIVDITGSTPLDLNFLTENILHSIFRNFGDPYMLPYTAALNEPHVQVLFGSMTEALAACMAFGEWYDREQKVDSFFYRVRINPSDKEAILIQNSGGTPEEAFKLDYFVNVRNEIIQKHKVDSDKGKTLRIKSCQNKGIQKTKFVGNSEPKSKVSKHQIAHRAPILCVPVIAPLNSYAEALMASGKQLNVDYASSILNIQKTLSYLTVDNVDREINSHPSIQDKTTESVSDCSSVERSEQLGSISEQASLGYVSVSASEKLDSISRKPMQDVVSRRRRYLRFGGPSRVFQRSK